jgi:hypothetical protein
LTMPDERLPGYKKCDTSFIYAHPRDSVID